MAAIFAFLRGYRAAMIQISELVRLAFSEEEAQQEVSSMILFYKIRLAVFSSYILEVLMFL